MKFLPIHAAISLKAPSIKEELLSLHSSSALSLDDKGRVPLHLAVLHEAAVEVFEKLLSASPEAIDVTNEYVKPSLNVHLEAFYNRERKLLSKEISIVLQMILLNQ